MMSVSQTVRRTIERRPWVRKALLGCGIASSMLYVTTDVVASLRYPGYRYADQEFSELTAQGAPTRNFMIALNVIPYTLMTTAFAAGVRASTGEGRAGQATTAGLLSYAAFGAVGGGLVPMETRGNEQTLRNAMHIPATALMSLGILLATASGSRLLGRRLRFYTYGTMATLVLFGLLTSLQAGNLAANEPTPWMGIEERINIYATMLWLAALAAALLRDEGESSKKQALLAAEFASTTGLCNRAGNSTDW